MPNIQEFLEQALSDPGFLAFLKQQKAQQEAGGGPTDSPTDAPPTSEEPALTEPPAQMPLASEEPYSGFLGAKTPGENKQNIGAIAAGATSLAGGLASLFGDKRTQGRRDANRDSMYKSAHTIADSMMQERKRELVDEHQTKLMLLEDTQKAAKRYSGIDFKGVAEMKNEDGSPRVPTSVLNSISAYLSKGHWPALLGQGGRLPDTKKMQEFLSFDSSVWPLIQQAQQEQGALEDSRIKQVASARGIGRSLRTQGDSEYLNNPALGGPMPSEVNPISDLNRGLAHQGEQLQRVPFTTPSGESFTLPPGQAATHIRGQASLDQRIARDKAMQDLRQQALDLRARGPVPKDMAIEIRKQLYKRVFELRAANDSGETDAELLAKVDSYVGAMPAAAPTSQKGSGTKRFSVVAVEPPTR